MKSKVATGVARRLLMTVAVIALVPAAFAQSNGADGTDPQSFFVLNNPGDPNFNQLLGINDGRIIVGYFGDGTVVANNGYVLVPKNHYSVENFTNLPSGDFADTGDRHQQQEISRYRRLLERARRIGTSFSRPTLSSA
jgi:hypothetical protein